LKDGTKVLVGTGKNARGGKDVRFGWHVSIGSKEHFSNLEKKCGVGIKKRPRYERFYLLNNKVGHDMVGVAVQLVAALEENLSVRQRHGIPVVESKIKMSG